MRKLSILSLAVLALGAAGLGAEPREPLSLVPQLDPQRYAGRWYEIARFQHRFEKTLEGVTAEYALRPDGRIDVVNSGFKNGLDGPYSSIKALAWVPDPARPAALKVRFFGLFASDYLVFGLDQEGYEWALVGDDSRDFLWFLARKPEIPEDLFENMKAMAACQGFDVSKLHRLSQKAR